MEFIELFKRQIAASSGKVSKLSLKNYASDIRHFIQWYEATTGNIFRPEIITADLLNLYTKSSGAIIIGGRLQQEKLSSSSMKRHLSSLRKFMSVMEKEGLSEDNPFEEMNQESSAESYDYWHFDSFKEYLATNSASKLTIKNYLADIRGFASWYEQAILPGIASPLTSTEGFYKISQDVVEEYKNRLVQIQSSAPRTINRKLSSLRRYLEFATRKGFIAHEEIIIPSVQLEQKDEVEKPTVQLSELNKIETEEKRIYSGFPPARLLQKLIIFPYLFAEEAIASKVATILSGKEIVAGVALSQVDKLRMQTKAIVNAQNQTIDSILGVRNVKKEFYAPHQVQLSGLPLHKKIVYHAKYTRPNWYKTYHSYPFVHYAHFALLIIFAVGVGVAAYQNLVGQDQKPTFAAPTAPPRILSFQGRLTDANDNPITSATDIRFAIYNDITASGGALLWQEVHYVVYPDQDGIFSVLLGTNTTIPSTVFSDNAGTYLGVTINQTSELTPRQRIASVAYATNSEQLQGMQPITAIGAGTSNVVLALDSSGNLTIGGSANPTFTASGGQFKISGQPLLLTTNASSNGNVIISPDGLGTIDLQKPLTNTTATGNLTPGGVEVNDKFGVLATESAVAAFTVNNDGSSDIFTASSGGTTRFTIGNTGALTIPTYNTNGGIFYANGSGVVAQTSAGLLGQCLQSVGGGTPTWGTCGGADGSKWRISNGALSPINDTLDLLVGSNASASAKFGFLNVGNGTPTASISANSGNNATTLSGNGFLGTTNKQTLSIGNGSTGNVIINSQTDSNTAIGTTSTLGTLKIAGNSPGKALVNLQYLGSGQNILVASNSAGTNVFTIEEDGDIIVGDGGSGKLTAAIIDPYLIQNQYTAGNTQLTFQTMAASNGDFIFQNQSTELARLLQAGQLQLPITGSSGGLSIGGDTQLFRGASDRLDLATGDSFNVVSGNIQIGGSTVIDSSSNGTFANLTVTGSCSGCISAGNSPFKELAGSIVPNNSTLDFLVGGQATTSAKFGILNIGTGTPTASISANSGNNATYLSGDGNLATTNKQTLTLGGSSTGLIKVTNGTGTTFATFDTVNSRFGLGTTAPAAKIDSFATTEQLRLSYDASNYSSFTTGSAGDLTIAPSGGDTAVTGNLDVSSHAAFGSSASVSTANILNLSETFTDTTTLRALNNTPRLDTTTDFTSTAFGLNNNFTISGSGNQNTGRIMGFENILSFNSTGTSANIAGIENVTSLGASAGNATAVRALYNRIDNNSSTGTITTANTIEAANPLGSGAITTLRGLYVPALTRGSTNNIGIQIDTPSGATNNYALYLAGTGGTAASGINFGSDTNLYRSAADTLKTDDAFNVNGNLNITSAGAISAATGITSSGTITLSTFTSNGGVLYTNGSGVLAQATAGTSSQCLLGGTTPSFGSCATGTTPSPFQELAGSIVPNNSTLDLLIGGQATTSAKFGILNIGTGTPTASISANSGNIAAYITGDGTLATTNKQSLTIGNSSTYNTTGNVLINSNGTGNVGIGTTIAPAKLNSLATTEQLRLLYDSSNYSSFTVNSGGDLTVAPSGGDSNITGTLDVSGHGAIGGGASISTTQTLQVAESYTLTSGNIWGGNFSTTFTPSSASSATVNGIQSILNTTADVNLTGILKGANIDARTNISPGASSTISTLRAVDVTIGIGSSGTSGSTLSTATGINIAAGNLASGTTISSLRGIALSAISTTGTITNSWGVDIANYAADGNTSYGMLIQDQAATGGSHYGLAIAGADTQALWISSGANNTDAANGIAFGSSRDTNLYRSAANTLATDDSLTVAGSAITFSTFISNGGILYTNGSGVLAQTGAGSASQCLLGGTTPSFGSCASGSTSSPFQELAGSIVPNNSTLDLLIGGQATASAKFALLNVAVGTPTASISANTTNNNTFLTGLGNLGTTNAQTLTLGGSTTGNVVIDSGSSAISLLDDTSITGNLSLSGTTGLTLSGSNADITFSGSSFHDITASSGTLRLGALTLLGTITGNNQILNDIGNVSANSSSNILTGFGTIGTSSVTNFNGTTLTLSGSSTDITSGTNEDLTITANGSGNLILTSDFNTGVKIGSSSNIIAPLSVAGGIGLNAAFILDQLNSGDLFVASAAGVTKFALTNAGSLQLTSGQTIDTLSSGTLGIGTTNATTLTVGRSGQGITLPGFTGQNGILYGTSGTGVLAQATTGSSSQCLLSGASNPTWGTCPGAGSSSSNWVLSSANGTLSPINNTVDLLLGASATTSAKFAFLNVAGGTPTATISAQNAFGNALSLSANGTIQTSNLGELTLGGTQTGGITLTTQLDPLGDGIAYGKIKFNPTPVYSDYINTFLTSGSALATSQYTLGGYAIDQAYGKIVGMNFQPILRGIDSSGALMFGSVINPLISVPDGEETGIVVGQNIGFLEQVGTGGVGAAYSLVIDDPTATLNVAPENAYSLVVLGRSNFNNTVILDAVASSSSTLSFTGTTDPKIDILNGEHFGIRTSAGGNTDLLERLTIANNGRVGIGTLNAPTGLIPTSMFQVFSSLGTSPAASISGQTSAPALLVTNEGVGDLFVASRAGVTRFRVQNNGNLIVGDGGGAGSKITVETNDPLYNIDGKKYSTFTPSMLGFKEEITGRVVLTYDPQAGAYAYTFDFNNAVRDSDFWVFTRVIKPDIKDVSILMTPNSAARTWYKKDGTSRRITMYADRPVEISYRMTAPQINSDKYPTIALPADYDIKGVNTPPAPNPVGSSEGDNNISVDPYFASLTINEENGQWVLKDSYSNKVNHIDAFSKLIVAHIQGGLIQAKKITSDTVSAGGATFTNITASALSLSSDTITISGQNIRDFIIATVQDAGFSQNGNQIPSPLATIDQIKTNVISPLAEEGSVALHVNPDDFSITNTETDEIVAQIDNEGNATFSGTLESEVALFDEASISGTLASNTLEANNASIAGTLRANKIIANDIEGIDNRISSIANGLLNNTNASNSGGFISGGDLAVGSINAQFGLFEQGIVSLGSGTFSQLTAIDSIAIGQGFILGNNSINTLGADLEIQPLRQGNISFMAGRITIDTDGNMAVDGNIQITGNIAAARGIFTDTLESKSLITSIISPLADSDLIFKLGGDSFATQSGKLQIQDTQGNQVLAINNKGDIVSSGSAKFGKINLNLVGEAEALNENQAVATGSAGFATLRRNRPEITIINPNVTKDSLIYITPFGDTNNKVLYLLRQIPNDPSHGTQGSFTVGVSGATTTQDLQFNWLIVN